MNKSLLTLALLCVTPLATYLSNETSASTTSQMLAATPEQRLLGYGVRSEGGFRFKLCGQKKLYRVFFEPKAQNFISSFLERNTHEFFIDAWGTMQSDASIRISRMERAYQEGTACKETLSSFLFKARGNEPFWALTISKESIRFERPAEATPYKGPYSLVREENNVRHYRTKTETGHLDVILSEKLCRDDMTGALAAWTAKVSFDKKTWTGCAYAGSE